MRPPPSVPTTATDVIVRIATTNFRLNTGNTSQAQLNGDSFWNMSQRWAFLRTTSANSGSIKLLDSNGNQVTTINNVVNANVLLFDSQGINQFDPLIAHPGGLFYYDIVNASDNAFARQLDLVWSPVPVPEPATVLAVGALGLGMLGYRRFRIPAP